MTDLPRGLGHVPDVVDPRDVLYRIAAASAAVPASISRSQLVDEIDQGALGSCGPFAASQAVRVDILRQKLLSGSTLLAAKESTEFLSWLFTYFYARGYDGVTALDVGSQIRNIYKSFNDVGFCPGSAWTYDVETDPKIGKFAREPDANAVRLAFDQCLAADAADAAPVVRYRRISSSGYAKVDEVRAALSEDVHPLYGCQRLVTFGTAVTNAFCRDWSGNGGKPIAPPTNGKDLAGNHAMIWGGYDAAGVNTHTSWGSFGDHGWFKQSWDYVAWDSTVDLWVVQMSPVFSNALGAPVGTLSREPPT